MGKLLGRRGLGCLREYRYGHNAAQRGIPMNMDNFLAAVAERTSAPGGGAGAAVGCALGAALAEMAARFAGVEPAVERAAKLRAETLRLADADADAYALVLEALRLPADDPRREPRLRAASSAAAEP